MGSTRTAGRTVRSIAALEALAQDGHALLHETLADNAAFDRLVAEHWQSLEVREHFGQDRDVFVSWLRSLSAGRLEPRLGRRR